MNIGLWATMVATQNYLKRAGEIENQHLKYLREEEDIYRKKQKTKGKHIKKED